MQSISFVNVLKNFLFGIFAILAASLFFIQTTHAQVGIPASGVDLDGYAWSDTIGWVSMNCRTGGSVGENICGTSNYKVSISSAGNITGYAWSSNIGWVRFGGLSDFPTTGGTTAVNARVTGTYPNLTLEGWARACAGDNMDTSCGVVVSTSSPSFVWNTTGTTGANWTDILYANNEFIAVGNNTLMTSLDGTSWISRTAPAANLSAVAYGNGTYVAVRSVSSFNTLSSSDGIVWTPRAHANSNVYHDVIFANGTFVAVGNNFIKTSPDGITWTNRLTSSEVNMYHSVAYGGGLFAAVATGGVIKTSPDGITWTQRSAPAPAGVVNATDTFNSMVYAGGLFVAVSANRNSIITSVNGITWFAQTLSGAQTLSSISYGSGMFIVAGVSSVSAPFYATSSNGSSWSSHAFDGGGSSELEYGEGNFVAASVTGLTQISGLSTPYTGTGWDGWISLRGTTPDYSIIMTAAGATATSYGWGSTVVGWLNFDNVGYVGATGVVSGTNCTIPQGASTCDSNISWNITGAASPILRNNTRGIDYSTNPAGTTTPYAIRQGANTIQVRDGSTVLASVTLNGTCVAGTDFSNGSTCELTIGAAPVVTITTNKRIARVGDTVGVTWTLNPSPIPSGSCALTGPGMGGPVTTSGTQTSASLRSKTRYTITCTGAFPTVTASTEVEIIPVAGEV